MVTLGQSVGGAVLIYRNSDSRLYPLVLFPSLYRIVPYLLGLAQLSRIGLQDEAVVAAFLGVNLLLVAGGVILPLAALAWYGTRERDGSPRNDQYRYTISSIRCHSHRSCTLPETHH